MRVRLAALPALVGTLFVPDVLVLAEAPPRQAVTFAIEHDTGPGESVFVVGDPFELGAGDLTRAIKLVPGVQQPGGRRWSIDVSLPAGVEYTYRYVTRAHDVDELSDPSNGEDITGTLAGATDPGDPPARSSAAFVFADSGATVVTFHTDEGEQTLALQPVPGFPDLLAASVPDQRNGAGVDAVIGDEELITPLHAVLLARRDELYNYVPLDTTAPFGIRETFVIDSAYVPPTRTIDDVTGRGVEVWLPRGYEEQVERRYPVLYMHDGQNVFNPGGPFGTWRAEDIAGKQIHDGLVRELIIVAIDNASIRLSEYNPDWPGGDVDNANYNRFLVEELKPYVDATYRTRPGVEHTGIGGSSFGGIASFSAALEHPDVYGRVLAMSTSFWATSIDDRLADGELPLTSRVYMDAGDVSDGGDDTVGVRDALLETGRVLHRDLFFQIGFGHQHNEAAWSDRLDEALRALFPVVEDDNALLALPLPIPGDTDADCDVDLADLSTLLAAFGSAAGDDAYDPAADIDGSGTVDLVDLSTLLTHFGHTCLP